MKTRKAKASDGIREGYILNCPLSQPTPAVASTAMEGEARHTPTPWETDGLAIIGPRREQEIAICTSDEDIPHLDAYANAALIIRAVNAYEKDQEIKKELLNALQIAQATIERLNPAHSSTQGTHDVINKAIAKAEGK